MILVLATSLGISNASAQTGITVGTNSYSFKQGQMVIITGNTASSSVTIQVQDPTGLAILLRSVTTDSNGNFEVKFKIPQTAKTGDYKVIATTATNNIPVIGAAMFKVGEGNTILEPDVPATVPTISTTEQSNDGGCLIATATFGSEMAPQVQFLRELRDNTVLQTESGISFMTSFNQFYYSFSPAIADYERENPAFKEAVKITLPPLLTSLTLLQFADIDSECEMLGYGIGIILLNIGMYFVVPAILVMKVRKII